jgi:hypothetical protein
MLLGQCGLIKESIAWVPKMVIMDQMARKVETLQDKVVNFLGKAIIQKLSAVAMHMPEMIW